MQDIQINYNEINRKHDFVDNLIEEVEYIKSFFEDEELNYRTYNNKGFYNHNNDLLKEINKVLGDAKLLQTIIATKRGLLNSFIEAELNKEPLDTVDEFIDDLNNMYQVNQDIKGSLDMINEEEKIAPNLIKDYSDLLFNLSKAQQEVNLNLYNYNPPKLEDVMIKVQTSHQSLIAYELEINEQNSEAYNKLVNNCQEDLLFLQALWNQRNSIKTKYSFVDDIQALEEQIEDADKRQEQYISLINPIEEDLEELGMEFIEKYRLTSIEDKLISLSEQ